MVIVGVAAPPLGQALKPYVGEAVFALLTLAFLRADFAALKALARRPTAVLAAVAWTIGVLPLATIGLFALGGAELVGDDLALALLLQAVSLPLMAAPALAALIGLDATLTLAGLLVASIAVPATAPLLLGLGDVGLNLPQLELAGLLAAMLGGSAALGLLLRRLIGPARIAERAAAVDGLNVLVLFVFIASVMGDVGPNLVADPSRILGLAALGIFVNLALAGITWGAFSGFVGRRVGLAIALLASQRNLGLMLAVAGDRLPETVWLYVAVNQLPIYLTPAILKPLSRRL